MDDARYFISLIMTKNARDQVDRDGFVRLKAEYLRKVMHPQRYNAVIDALLQGGAAIRSPYTVGSESFGYKLGDRYAEDQHMRVPVKDSRLAQRLQLFHEKAETARLARMKPVHYALEAAQHRLRIYGDEAREIISRLPQKSNRHDAQGILVRDIEEHRFHVNVGRYGRMTNNITSLKREVRKALHVDNERLANVDISCCQPALIGKMLRETKAAKSFSTTSTANKPAATSERSNE
jgi:hypothetical protein